MSEAQQNPPQSKSTRSTVSDIDCADPFCSSDVTVSVDKPDTSSSATVTLASSVSGTTIMPSSVSIPARQTSGKAFFNATLPNGASGTVTFTATTKQSGHADHSMDRTVDIDCSESNGQHPRVVSLGAPSPVPLGRAVSVVAHILKPDTAAGATVTLTSSLAGAIAPASREIAAKVTKDAATFAVTIGAGVADKSVTFTASIAQDGYPDNSRKITVALAQPAGD